MIVSLAREHSTVLIACFTASMNKQMKERRPPNGPVEDVGDILLSRVCCYG